MITLYNTLTKTKERLIPRHDKKIQMFVCGPTVYDYIHIGNARTFVFFDVVAKYLRSPLLRPSSTEVSEGKQGSEGQEGYEVDYIQNITDIDDKIIQRAKEAGRDPLDWAKEYRQKFEEDMKALGVSSPKYAPATEYIEQVVKQVKTLIDKGHAYLIEDDGYYFDLSTFKDYGKLSGRTALTADDAVSRIDENSKKKNKGDFCLWKLAKKDGPEEVRPQISKEVEPRDNLVVIDGEPAWNTELGWGRPGWHIEDTAITEHYFGPQYDIHGGGQDLIFPHHEAEITQQESASGKKPFVKYWMHVAFIIVNKGQKMSKSLGNFETVRDLLKKYPKEVLRFYLLSGYYRSPLDYGDDMLKQSQAAISRILEFKTKLDQVLQNQYNSTTQAVAEVVEIIDKYFLENKDGFFRAMDNDFNTPEAFASIFEMIRIINPFIAENRVSEKQAKEILGLLKDINSIVGIIPSEQQKIPAEVKELIEKREKFREEKNYNEADKIRTQIQALGWEVEDTIYGPLVLKNH
ncbi:MAG: cysteine--tRNA ligase [Candidatus Taylorbacteria bacterium]|nr:cysteine--tRNA ligase [Candidatus Taylorbacteria bacterium]